MRILIIDGQSGRLGAQIIEGLRKSGLSQPHVIIAGPIGITLADAMLGEVTPLMAAAVGRSAAQRILLPSDRCATLVVGVQPMTRKQLVDAAVDRILQTVSAAEGRMSLHP